MSKYKVAVTGGIGSGKSTVCDCLRKLGFLVYSCDEISKQLFSQTEYQIELLQLFPECEENGAINRKKLAETVFSNAEELEKLNAFSHGKIMKKLFLEMDSSSSLLSFAEVPLLFENGYEVEFDFVIVVERPLEARIAAVCARDGLDRSSVLKRMNNQWDYHSLAHKKMMQKENYFSLQNIGDEERLKILINDILEAIKKTIT